MPKTSIPYGKRDLTSSVIKRLKREAKKLKKQPSIISLAKNQNTTPQRFGLDLIAKREGFKDWNTLDRAHQRFLSVSPVAPQPSLSFIHSDEFEWTDEEIERYIEKERTADIEDSEKLKVASNRAILAELGIEYSIFEPTITGLKKSILDATQAVRFHFKLVNFHVYEMQNQGPDFKVVKDAFFIDYESKTPSKVSLYRPKTKQGDPRMWFRGLSEFAQAGNQIAIIVFEDCSYLLNLSELDLRAHIADKNIVSEFLESYQSANNTVSNELLAKLRELAKAPIPAIKNGDTAIGMTLEHALGIPANSSKKPDYKGIELKTGRNPKNRSNLFAQVADWKLSACKSSREILERYGYQRDDGAFGLYCTISSIKRNSQGLQFHYIESTDQLHEEDEDGNNVAVWKGALLRERLNEKHSETFWVDADSVWVDDVEHFQLKTVTHTKKPLLGQLMPLLQTGVITMDHLIKRSTGEKPRVVEKGPLFKINKKDLPLLFPKPQKYQLIEGENNDRNN